MRRRPSSERIRFTRALLGLHLLLALYSVSSVFSKLAGQQAFMSGMFILYYGIVLAILALYALGWQQCIKRMPLTTAYANKAITIVWGIVFGVIFFSEEITPGKLIGAALIMAGIALFAIEDGKYQQAREKVMNKQLKGPDTIPPSSEVSRDTGAAVSDAQADGAAAGVEIGSAKAKGMSAEGTKADGAAWDTEDRR
jgi:multidrug transporter EmrE-like cation transporter